MATSHQGLPPVLSGREKKPHLSIVDIIYPSFMVAFSGDIITYLKGISCSIFLFCWGGFCYKETNK